MARTLAALHTVVPGDVGLSGYGKAGGYNQRQVRASRACCARRLCSPSLHDFALHFAPHFAPHLSNLRLALTACLWNVCNRLPFERVQVWRWGEQYRRSVTRVSGGR